MVVESTKCCGILEIHNLRTESAPGAMRRLCKQYWSNSRLVPDPEPNGRFMPLFPNIVLFTAVVDGANTYGQNFAKLIAENDLGTVVESEERKNPNTGYTVKGWLWSINKDKLKEWYLAQLEAAREKRKDGSNV